MSIDINVSNNIATIELDVPPVNAFDSSQWFDLSAVSYTHLTLPTT